MILLGITFVGNQLAEFFSDPLYYLGINKRSKEDKENYRHRFSYVGENLSAEQDNRILGGFNREWDVFKSPDGEYFVYRDKEYKKIDEASANQILSAAENKPSDSEFAASLPIGEKVDDAFISKEGAITRISDDDNILAMKNFDALVHPGATEMPTGMSPSVSNNIDDVSISRMPSVDLSRESLTVLEKCLMDIKMEVKNLGNRKQTSSRSPQENLQYPIDHLMDAYR